MNKTISNKILDFVIAELESRDIINFDIMENCFGCKSYEDVSAGIDKILKEHTEKFANEFSKALMK